MVLGMTPNMLQRTTTHHRPCYGKIRRACLDVGCNKTRKNGPIPDFTEPTCEGYLPRVVQPLTKVRSTWHVHREIKNFDWITCRLPVGLSTTPLHHIRQIAGDGGGTLGVTSSARSQSGFARRLASKPLLPMLPAAFVAGYESERCWRTLRKVSGSPNNTLTHPTQRRRRKGSKKAASRFTPLAFLGTPSICLCHEKLSCVRHFDSVLNPLDRSRRARYGSQR